MFGTLVLTDFDQQGTLEFVENTDPVAAVSRNLRDKIHISCTFCRSRKIRCSGDRNRCQRCVAMGLDCVYPKTRGRNKHQDENKTHRASIHRDANVRTQIVCDEADSSTRNGQADSGEELAMDDLHGITFDDSCMDESMFTPWMMDTLMQHNLDGGSISSSCSTAPSAVEHTASESPFSAPSRSVTVASPGQLPELSTTDTPLTSLHTSSTTDSAGDLESWDEPHMAHGDIAWAMTVDGYSSVDPTPEPLSLEPWGKARTRSDSCRCLVTSISFLERLVSKSASRPNRIDLLLADVRNSIETLAIFMACERCAGKAEQNMLLAMAARQISVLCGKTSKCYKAMHMGAHGEANSSRRKAEADASACPVDISVSTYRVNRRERLHLIKSLVSLQIVDLQQHINSIKSRYRNRPNHGQAEALVEAENHIKLAQADISSHS